MLARVTTSVGEVVYLFNLQRTERHNTLSVLLLPVVLNLSVGVGLITYLTARGSEAL
jgi:hypothetical protein